jgi:hypothetical protein
MSSFYGFAGSLIFLNCKGAMSRRADDEGQSIRRFLQSRGSLMCLRFGRLMYWTLCRFGFSVHLEAPGSSECDASFRRRTF